MMSMRMGAAPSRPRVHVTGGSGFIGRAVAARLAGEGYEVSASDLHGSEEVAALDLRERAGVIAHIADLAPDIVVHAGAISGTMLAIDDPALMFDVNVAGTLNLVEAMRRAGVPRLVFLSSNAVYAPAPSRAPVSESAALGPSDAYGASKLAAEAVLRCYGESHAISTLALRVSSVFGPGRVTPYLISQTLDALGRRAPLTVTDERSNMRQFIHIDDAVEAVCRAVETEHPGFTPINITGGTYLSEEAIVRILAAGMPDADITVIADRGCDDDGRVGPLDITRAQALLGYVPSIDIAAALADLARAAGAGTSAPDPHAQDTR
ncbi:NAD-dependent epimerase/dehydratase family protein [Ancylobacter pratisalsi]|uniref:NAD(P)-dependent oxidoreductase n=1 Tax=Ancylobacter pratisalsi TaxID=1745854 RepID=A0A6P1YQ50_9HYPH|nr:NAD(P)-dependent oxidoreductase [Ancylobacter pratisalsi]QIB35568.1 NAD(P)-dependent oxidoreductase [Ancylobacter pratisalsi]